MQKYNYLIVGSGLFGSIFAYEANKAKKKCLVIEQKNHIGGTCYTKNNKGIEIHKYGAHIFNTNSEERWNYIRQFGEFNNFINTPLAMVDGVIYNLPFNMNMFSKVFGINKPEEAEKIISSESMEYKNKPKNLKEKCIQNVGKTIYEMFIEGYNEKQWGKKCSDLPPSIINRIPIRLTYDNNYSNTKYQGVPVDGYTKLIEKMLNGIEIMLNTKYKDVDIKADKIIYTGSIDEFFDYRFDRLDYRSLEFVEIEKDCSNYQGNAVINYPDKNTPYIRSIEHKHFVDSKSPNTIISYEFPTKCEGNALPVYPIEDNKNIKLYERYKKLKKKNVYFCGRLGSYKYTNMDDTIKNALKLVKDLI